MKIDLLSFKPRKLCVAGLKRCALDVSEQCGPMSTSSSNVTSPLTY